MGTTVPIGAIMMWTTASAPTNWLICDGGAFTVGDYPSLAVVLAGGVVPDMQGLFVRGVGTIHGSAAGILKSVGGAGVGTMSDGNKITTNELPEHKHDITDPGHTHNTTVDTGAIANLDTTPRLAELLISTGQTSLTSDSATTGITETDNGGGVNAASLQEYTPLHYVVNYIIYRGPLGA